MSLTPRQRWSYSNWASHLISCQCAHTRRVLIVSPCLTLIYRRRTDVIGDLVVVARWFVAFIAVLRFWFHSTPRRWVHGCEQECVVSIIILKLSTSVGETRSANHFSLIKNWPIRKLHRHLYELHPTCLSSEAGLEVIYFTGCRNFWMASLLLQDWETSDNSCHILTCKSIFPVCVEGGFMLGCRCRLWTVLLMHASFYFHALRTLCALINNMSSMHSWTIY